LLARRRPRDARGADRLPAGYNEAIRQRPGHLGEALYTRRPTSALYAVQFPVSRSSTRSRTALGQTEFTVEDIEGNWLTFWKSPETSA
jgi:hypothetical protein